MRNIADIVNWDWTLYEPDPAELVYRMRFVKTEIMILKEEIKAIHTDIEHGHVSVNALPDLVVWLRKHGNDEPARAIEEKYVMVKQ